MGGVASILRDHLMDADRCKGDREGCGAVRGQRNYVRSSAAIGCAGAINRYGYAARGYSGTALRGDRDREANLGIDGG